MTQTAQDAYLESRVYAADPIELVRLLYQGCLAAVREARRLLAAGEIAARVRSISKGCAILTELIVSLDRERGGEIALRLAALYDYMQRKLIEANFQQADEPLAEVLGLLATLADAWDGIQAQAQPAHSAGAAWAPAAQEPAAAYSAQGWSF
jgi:flagellar protein FliS